MCIGLMAEFVENSGCQAEEHDGTNSIDVTEPLYGTSDPAVTVPRGLWSANHELKQKKLVLHVDLNNTILVSDAVTAQGTVAALDYFLTTVTWGKLSKHGNLKQEFDLPFTVPPWLKMLGIWAQSGDNREVIVAFLLC